LRVAGAVLGAFLVAASLWSVAWTLVIPRGRLGIQKHLDRAIDGAYVAIAKHLGSFDQRDRLLASEPAALLAALLLTWLVGLILGFALVLWPIDTSFPDALREAGSSMFTLGFAGKADAGSSVVDFCAAAVGLIIVALQIAYLPTLYGAYNRRETEIRLLSARSGIPAWGPEVIARFGYTKSLDNVPAFYESWERWAADVAESHASYPSLLRFRSPEAQLSWLVGLLAVLDSAALYLAAAPSRAPMQARLALQMGFTCLRVLGRTIGFEVDLDPRPDAPIRLSEEEFLEGWQRLVDVSFPTEVSWEEAWRQFRGWRVNYEEVAYRLAYALDAVPAAWSGPRRHGDAPMKPRAALNRTPNQPVEGEAPSF